MTACATRNNIEESFNVCNLIIPVPDADFRDFLEEVDNLKLNSRLKSLAPLKKIWITAADEKWIIQLDNQLLTCYISHLNR